MIEGWDGHWSAFSLGRRLRAGAPDPLRHLTFMMPTMRLFCRSFSRTFGIMRAAVPITTGNAVRVETRRSFFIMWQLSKAAVPGALGEVDAAHSQQGEHGPFSTGGAKLSQSIDLV